MHKKTFNAVFKNGFNPILATTTYKSIGRSVLEYGNPIWSPEVSVANWKHLQIEQNQALRVATGCLAMTSLDHLHQETKVLPIKHHTQILTEQFVLAMHLPGHPGQKQLGRPRRPRKLQTKILKITSENAFQLLN